MGNNGKPKELCLCEVAPSVRSATTLNYIVVGSLTLAALPCTGNHRIREGIAHIIPHTKC